MTRRVDALLDDPAFFAPFVPFFDPVIGRPSTPVECYLRLMFLKFRYRLGFESLCAEVADSISWRRFCRIPIDGKVPHPATLMKLTTRWGEAAVAGLNEALWAKAAWLVVGPTRADGASRCRRPSPSAGPRRTQRVTLTTYATDIHLAAKSGAGLNSAGRSYETR